MEPDLLLLLGIVGAGYCIRISPSPVSRQMTPGPIPEPYEYIGPNDADPNYRFKGLDELMEMKYGGQSETGGKTMNLGRGALYALLLGILWIVAPSLAGNIYSPVMGLVRDTFSLGDTYFAVQSFLNFVTGGLMNLLAFEAFSVAVILFGLSRGRSGTLSSFPASDKR